MFAPPVGGRQHCFINVDITSKTGTQGGMELRDGEANSQVEKVLIMCFVLPKAPEVGCRMIPVLYTHVVIHNDAADTQGDQDRLEENIEVVEFFGALD